MNVFIAGIHGAGKSYLASRAAHKIGMVHTSASKLIKEERTLMTWNDDKRVSDVNANQCALVAAVRRHNEEGIRLLLDGHFVLLNESGEMIRLNEDVFAELNLKLVILIEAEPHIVAQRIALRDQRQLTLDHLNSFLLAEREQAESVCEQLDIPLAILLSPSEEKFMAAVLG
jgi:adenylate kinase